MGRVSELSRPRDELAGQRQPASPPQDRLSRRPGWTGRGTPDTPEESCELKPLGSRVARAIGNNYPGHLPSRHFSQQILNPDLRPPLRTLNVTVEVDRKISYVPDSTQSLVECKGYSTESADVLTNVDGN